MAINYATNTPAMSPGASVTPGSALGRKYKLQGLTDDIGNAVGGYIQRASDPSTPFGPVGALFGARGSGIGSQPAPAPAPVAPGAAPVDPASQIGNPNAPYASGQAPRQPLVSIAALDNVYKPLATAATSGTIATNQYPQGTATPGVSGPSRLVWNANAIDPDTGRRYGRWEEATPAAVSQANYNPTAVDSTAAGSAARDAAASATASASPSGSDLSALTRYVNGVINNSPFQPGTQQNVQRAASLQDAVTRNFAGSDQALRAQLAGMGMLGTGAEAGAMGGLLAQQAAAHQGVTADMVNNDPQRLQDQLGGALGLRGQAQTQDQSAQMFPVTLTGAQLANQQTATMNPLYAQMLGTQIAGAQQQQGFAGQMFPVELAGEQQNVNFQGAMDPIQIQNAQQELNMFKDSYGSVLSKLQSGAQLSQAEAAQAQFVANNPWLMAFLGVVPGLAQAGATMAGKAGVGMAL